MLTKFIVLSVFVGLGENSERGAALRRIAFRELSDEMNDDPSKPHVYGFIQAEKPLQATASAALIRLQETERSLRDVLLALSRQRASGRKLEEAEGNDGGSTEEFKGPKPSRRVSFAKEAVGGLELRPVPLPYGKVTGKIPYAEAGEPYAPGNPLGPRRFVSSALRQNLAGATHALPPSSGPISATERLVPVSKWTSPVREYPFPAATYGFPRRLTHRVIDESDE